MVDEAGKAGLVVSIEECLSGTKAGFNSGKSPPEEEAGASPLCPQCGNKKVWRDGLRYSLFDDKIQRWSCRECGLRFSDAQDTEKSCSKFQRLERV